MAHWIKFEGWEGNTLYGISSDTRRSDMAAMINATGSKKWHIRAWKVPAIGPGNADHLVFEGTREEAKAVAVAMVRVG